MSGPSRWYARPVLHAPDVETTAAFYVDALGFARDWTYAEHERLVIVQVGRDGCEMILTSQRLEGAGSGLIFISLDAEPLAALRAELERKGVPVEEGWWGYRLMVVRDPAGHTLYFPYPAEDGAAA